MVSYVLNVRIDQLDADVGALHLPRFSLRAAQEIAGHEVLLFASRDENTPGYYGTATIGQAVPDQLDKHYYWLPLHRRHPLQRPVTLRELHALGIDEQPFHTYGRPIRPVPKSELQGLVALGVIPEGFGEQDRQAAYESPKYLDGRESVRYRSVRFEMLEHYGPACVFTGKVYPHLDGLGSGIDVGHLWPHSAGGPCIIQNVAPMTKDVNHQWDQGLISLRNNGDVLIASRAGSDTRALFSHIARIQFPKEVQHWPDAQYLERHRDEIFEKGPVVSSMPSEWA